MALQSFLETLGSSLAMLLECLSSPYMALINGLILSWRIRAMRMEGFVPTPPDLDDGMLGIMRDTSAGERKVVNDSDCKFTLCQHEQKIRIVARMALQ